MGLGIGILLKGLAPLTLYLSGLGCAVAALAGNIRWGLLFVAFLLPLRNVVDKVQAYPLGNKFFDIILASVLLGGMLHRKFSNSKSSINAVSLIIVLYMLGSMIWGGFYLWGTFSFDVHDSRVQDWKNFAQMPLLFYLNFKNNASKKDLWTMVAVMGMGVFLEDYYTIHQIKWHVSALASRDEIKGTFQFLGPNEVAAFLNEYTLIFMGLLYAVKNFKYKWLLRVLVFCSLYCILFLYSRGAYAGLTLGMFILFCFKDKKLLVPLVLVLLLWQVVLPQDVIDRIKETKNQYGQLDVSSQYRLDVWKMALGYFQSNPIMGIGWGSFRNMGLILGDTHNIYVKFLAEQGLIGLVLFLIIVVLFLREGWRLFRKGDDEISRTFGLGFVCCLAAMMVNNFFGDRWSYLEPNAYLWIFAALVARLNVISQNLPAAKERPPQPAVGRRTVAPQAPKKKVRYYDL